MNYRKSVRESGSHHTSLNPVYFNQKISENSSSFRLESLEYQPIARWSFNSSIKESPVFRGMILAVSLTALIGTAAFALGNLPPSIYDGNPHTIQSSEK